MKLLVTGGAGFIGSNYVRKVLSGELSGIAKLGVLDKFTYAGNKQNLSGLNQEDFELVVGDICDSSVVDKMTRNYDAIINFAAETHVDRSISNPESFVTTNINGTKTLLDSALKNEISTFVQISTDEVYGSIESGSWTENSAIVPNSPYSASKASGDLIARSYYKTYGLNAIVTRCCNNYGPFQHPEKAIPLFVTNLLKNKKIPLYGNGRNVREWIHVSDHCMGVHKALLQGSGGEIYHFAGTDSFSNLELAEKILSFFEFDMSHIEYVEDRKGHDFRYALDGAFTSRILGFNPNMNFENGLQSTIEWYTAHKSWWESVKIS